MIGGFRYPSILKRYLSSFIDGLLILAGYFSILGWMTSENGISQSKALLIGIFVFLYEPLCVSFICTIGQKIMRIRVRDCKNRNRKLSFDDAIIRSLTKATLGIFSFFMISVSKDRRAI